MVDADKADYECLIFAKGLSQSGQVTFVHPRAVSSLGVADGTHARFIIIDLVYNDYLIHARLAASHIECGGWALLAANDVAVESPLAAHRHD